MSGLVFIVRGEDIIQHLDMGRPTELYCFLSENVMSLN